MKTKLFLIFLISILNFGIIKAQNYFEYIEYFIQDISMFNSKLSASMAERIPIMANISNPDASTNLSNHIFTGGITVGSAFTPNFYASLTQDANYKLINVSDDIGISEDLNYLPLPLFTLFAKINTFSEWNIGAKINFIPSFERENFKFSVFTFTALAQKSLFKLGSESGLSLTPFFTYAKGSASYTTKPYVIPFSINNADFTLSGILNFELDFKLYSIGAEAKISQKLLFFHPFAGAMIYANFGETAVSTTPSIELRLINPPQLLLKTDLDFLEEKASPEAFMLDMFAGFEVSAFIVKIGFRLDYEINTSSLAAQFGVRFLL